MTERTDISEQGAESKWAQERSTCVHAVVLSLIVCKHLQPAWKRAKRRCKPRMRVTPRVVGS